MKKPCNKYMSEDISRFVDNELPRDLYRELAQHLHQCPDCSRLVENHKTISVIFNDYADHKDLKIDPDKLKQKFERITQSSKKNQPGYIFDFFSRNIYLKLASIAAILMASLFIFQVELFAPSGPSAIVTSVDTDFSSVMIIETQKEKHTIIWFSET